MAREIDLSHHGSEDVSAFFLMLEKILKSEFPEVNPSKKEGSEQELAQK